MAYGDRPDDMDALHRDALAYIDSKEELAMQVLHEPGHLRDAFIRPLYDRRDSKVRENRLRRAAKAGAHAQEVASARHAGT